MPQAVLTSLLQGSGCNENICVVNCSPYDGWVERATMSMGGTKHKFRSLTISSDVTTTQHSEKLLAMHLLEDWGPELLAGFSGC